MLVMSTMSAAYHKVWYAKNRVKRIKQIRASNTRILVRNKTYVDRYLNENPCVDCGEADIEVLQFDHVSGDKIACVSQLVGWSVSLERIKAEIAKCDVRCANCHIKATRKRQREKKCRRSSMLEPLARNQAVAG